MSGVNLSISEISAEFQQTRETVRKRLADAGIKAAGKRRNYPVFRLRDAIRALLSGPDADPNKLDPFRRKAHYQAEQAELALAIDREEVIRRGDVEETYAAAFKPIRLMLETLPDVLERDAGLSPAQVQRVERSLDELREQMHARVIKAVSTDPPAKVKSAKTPQRKNVRSRK
jgi:hypothetical protein